MPSAISPETWFLLLNPESGGGRGRKMQMTIESELHAAGVSFAMHITLAAGEAIDAVQKAIRNGYRKIIAVGGDGTFNETANGILSQEEVPSNQITLALIPTGTGNDWPRIWQISSDIRKTTQLIVKGFTQIQPAGLIRYYNNGQACQRWFVNVAGCGFDAEVASAANQAKTQGKSGILTYIGQLALTLFRFKEEPAEIQVNGQLIRLRLFAVLAGIGRYAGNGMMLVPRANPLSGNFSITLVEKIGRMKVLLNLFRLFSGSFTRFREVTLLQSQELSIQASGRLLLQADGESIGEAPVVIKIFPKKIKLIVPEKAW